MVSNRDLKLKELQSIFVHIVSARHWWICRVG